MEQAEGVQAYLDLSRSYLRAARTALNAGEFPPAHFLAVHALELAVKAMLLHEAGEIRRTHRADRAFGRLFRGKVATGLMRRVSGMLRRYGEQRYPGGEVPDRHGVESDLRFVEGFLEDVVPRVLDDG